MTTPIPATDPRWGEAPIVSPSPSGSRAVRKTLSVASLGQVSPSSSRLSPTQSTPVPLRSANNRQLVAPGPAPEPEPVTPQREHSSGAEPEPLAPRLSAMEGDELIDACLSDKPLEVVKDLLDRGVPINYAHRSTRRSVVQGGVDRMAGVTALHACASSTAAASGDRTEVLRLLLGRGANIEARTGAPHGLTPFCGACRAGNAACATMLQAARCDIEASSYEGLTGRQYADRADHRQVLRLFSAWGTKLELDDELRHSARRGRRGSVARLLKLGANPTAPGNSGGNALHLAVVTGDHSGVVETLLFGSEDGLESGSPRRDSGVPQELVESKTADNLMTAFACACYYGRPKSVAALLKAGCDVNAVDSVGWTGKDWAEHMEQQDVLRLLPRESRCERPASRLDTLLPEPRRPDREQELAAVKIQARLRGKAARREFDAESARRNAAAAAAAAHKEESEAKAAEAKAEAEWGDVTVAERELKRAELSGDEERIEEAKATLAKEVEEAEAAQAAAEKERAEAEEAHEAREEADEHHMKTASEAVLATVHSDQPAHVEQHARPLSSSPHPMELAYQERSTRAVSASSARETVALREELATLRSALEGECEMRRAAEQRADVAEVMAMKLRQELEAKAETAASAAEMRAVEAESRAAQAEERARTASAMAAVAEVSAMSHHPSVASGGPTSPPRQSSYKTRPFSGGNGSGGSAWQKGAKESAAAAAAAPVSDGGVEWVGVNRRGLFGGV